MTPNPDILAVAGHFPSLPPTPAPLGEVMSEDAILQAERATATSEASFRPRRGGRLKIDLRGKRFGTLTVLGRKQSGTVVCQCACGRTHEVRDPWELTRSIDPVRSCTACGRKR